MVAVAEPNLIDDEREQTRCPAIFAAGDCHWLARMGSDRRIDKRSNRTVGQQCSDIACRFYPAGLLDRLPDRSSTGGVVASGGCGSWIDSGWRDDLQSETVDIVDPIVQFVAGIWSVDSIFSLLTVLVERRSCAFPY